MQDFVHTLIIVLVITCTHVYVSFEPDMWRWESRTLALLKSGVPADEVLRNHEALLTQMQSDFAMLARHHLVGATAEATFPDSFAGFEVSPGLSMDTSKGRTDAAEGAQVPQFEPHQTLGLFVLSPFYFLFSTHILEMDESMRIVRTYRKGEQRASMVHVRVIGS